MEILLLRHGIAVDAEEVGGKDEPRMLTDEGREKVRKIGAALRKLGVKPDAIWSSPFPRAAETATLTAEALGCPERVKFDSSLEPGAAHLAFTNLLRRAEDHASVMMVGHNPDMERFAAYLISRDGEAALELKKGGLAVIHVEEGREGLKREGGGILAALYRPRDLCGLLS